MVRSGVVWTDLACSDYPASNWIRLLSYCKSVMIVRVQHCRCVYMRKKEKGLMSMAYLLWFAGGIAVYTKRMLVMIGICCERRDYRSKEGGKMRRTLMRNGVM